MGPGPVQLLKNCARLQPTENLLGIEFSLYSLFSGWGMISASVPVVSHFYIMEMMDIQHVPMIERRIEIGVFL